MWFFLLWFRLLEALVADYFTLLHPFLFFASESSSSRYMRALLHIIGIINILKTFGHTSIFLMALFDSTSIHSSTPDSMVLPIVPN